MLVITVHHIFISAELSIYVVVFSFEQCSQDSLQMTQLENLHLWLNSIHAQAPRAPILVVGTKADRLDADHRIRTIGDIDKSFAGAAFERQLVRCGGNTVVAVNNTVDDDPGVGIVRQTLADEASLLPGYGSSVPLGWLKFLDVVHELVDRGVYCVSLDEARALGRTVRATTIILESAVSLKLSN